MPSASALGFLTWTVAVIASLATSTALVPHFLPMALLAGEFLATFCTKFVPHRTTGALLVKLGMRHVPMGEC